MTYLPTSLTARLAQIAAQEREWMEQGYCVGTLCKDESRWAEMGVHTAADLDAYFDAEYAKEARKDAMAGWDDWDAESEAAWAAEQAALDAEAAELAAVTADPTGIYAAASRYQTGWL